MRVKCLHGFFIFDEEYSGEISDFMSISGLKIVSHGTYFTFSDLKAAPLYSLQGKSLLGLNAIKSAEGNPWDVFKSNGFVYDFVTGQMRPIQSITNIAKIESAGNRFYTNGLIPAGSLNQNSRRIESYSAWFSRETGVFLYSEVTYV